MSDITPKTLNAFERWLASTARKNQHIVILGDLFDSWIGDDLSSICIEQVKKALISAKNCGAICHFMHGNRDFLIGNAFLDSTHLDLLPDPYIIDLFGTDTLLTHGDQLCIDDMAYQKFREMSRTDAWQHDFLKKSLSARKKIANAVRKQSDAEKNEKMSEIMDASASAVNSVFAGRWTDRVYIGPVPRIIHGHTHRPGKTNYPGAYKNNAAERFVLPDWDFDCPSPRGGFLKISAEGTQLVQFNADF